MGKFASKSCGDTVHYSKFVFVYRQGVYGNALLLSRLEELSDSIQADFQSGNDAILESMNGKLRLISLDFFVMHLTATLLSDAFVY